MPRGTGLLNEAALQQRLWNPRHLLTQSTATPVWFDASDLSTISTANNEVNEWRCPYEGSSNRTLGGTGSITVIPNGLNGLSVLRIFTGAFFTLKINGVSSTYSGVGTTYFMVLLREGTGNITPMYFGSNSYPYLHYGSSWIYGNSNTITVPMNANQWYLASCISGERYWNGASVGGVRQTSADAVFQIMGGPFSTNSMRIAEFMFLEKNASQYELQLIEGYLAWKWGIQLAANHPYVNRPPLIGD